MDGGRVLQEGSASALAAAPASAFVADFTRRGRADRAGARVGRTGSTVVALDGGGEVTALRGRAGPGRRQRLSRGRSRSRGPARPRVDSARNHLEVEVVSVTTVGPRVRVGLAAPQPLTAELSRGVGARALGLAPGARAVASFKAAATRVLPR